LDMQKKLHNYVTMSQVLTNTRHISKALAFFCLFLSANITILRANTFVVTTTKAEGEGSFKQALQKANAHKGVDKIVFNIAHETAANKRSGTLFHTIQAGTGLLQVSDELIIDGMYNVKSTMNDVTRTPDIAHRTSDISHCTLNILLNTEGGMAALKNITFRGIGFVKNNKLTIQSGTDFVFENCVFINNPATFSTDNWATPIADDTHFKNCALEGGDDADPSYKCGTVGNFVKSFNTLTNFGGININGFIQKTAKTVLNNKILLNNKSLLNLRRDTILENNTQRIRYRLVSPTDTVPNPKGQGAGDPNEYCVNGSNVLSIIVSEKTVIVGHPSDIVECIDGNLELKVSIAGGTGTITYNWYESKDGITFGENPIFVGPVFIPPSKKAGTYYYRSAIHSDVDGCGGTTSTTATVTILEDPKVVVKADKPIMCEGETASLSTTITGGKGDPTYQWQKSEDGTTWTDIANATAASLIVPNLRITTYYRVKVVKGNGCETTSDAETVKISGCSGVIGDFVWLDCNKNGIQDAGEEGIGNAPVTLRGTTIAGDPVSVTQSTLPNGSYQFKEVKPGKYRLVFGYPNATKGLAYTQKGMGNNTNDSDPDSEGKTAEFNFGSNEVLTDIDAGFRDVAIPTIVEAVDKEVNCDGLGNEVELQAWLLSHGGATAEDNVSKNLIWKHNYTAITKGICGATGEAKVTFTVTDECGNSTTTTATFKIKDTQGPVFADMPKDFKLRCGEPIPKMRNPSVSDLCSPNIKIVPTEKEEILCGDTRKITRTWLATDACGNSTTATQTITTEDTDPPVLENVPNAPLRLSCKDPIPSGKEVTATDYCSGTMKVTMTDKPGRVICGSNYTINRQWTAIDNCGNVAEATQVITIGDFDPPVITGVPDDITVSCGNLIGIPSRTVKASAKCSDNIRLTTSDKPVPGPCTDQYVVLRTWTATDQCGNVSKKTQRITVKDEIKPELIGVPTDLVVHKYLGQTVPVKASVVGTDNCDSRVDLTFKETKTPTLCGEIIKRTWAATDNCQNRVEKSQLITINLLENLAKVVSITPEECNAKNGRVELSPSAINYIYKWSDGKTGALRTDLTAGTYQVTATSAINCAKILEIIVKKECDCDRPIVTVDKQDISCTNLLEQGKAVINVANGLPVEFNYIWTPAVSTNNKANNLAAGSYKVRVERLNKPSCFSEVTFNVVAKAPLVVADPVIVPAGCKTPMGKITFTIPVGDTLKFKWSNGDTTPVRSNLASGIYAVTITRPNSNTCPLERNVEVPSDNLMKSNYVINRQPSCGLPNGSVTINTTGGSGNYNYSWGEGNSRFVLVAGPQMVTVTDLVTGCFNVVSFVLNGSTPQVGIKMDSVVYTSCPSMSDARLIFELTLDDNFQRPAQAVISDKAGKLYSNGALPVGDYIVMIKDVTGCIVSERTFKVLDPLAITPVVARTAQSCDELGTITLTVAGGKAPHKYYWSDLPGQLDQPSYRESLKAGFYNVTISDAAGCQRLLRNINIKDSCACRPALIDSVETVASSCSQSNGKSTILLRGGLESNYTYNWSPATGTANAVGNSRTGLAAGIYSVTITAKNNLSCTTITKVSVGGLEGPKDVNVVSSPATCDLANGAANLTTTSSEIYTYTWIFDGKTSASRNDLKAGLYQVLVSKASNPTCQSSVSIRIESQSNLKAVGIIKQNATCGQANGIFAIRVTGGSGKYLFSGQTDSLKSGVKAGVYTVIVTDTVSKCKETVTFSMSEESASTATLTLASSNVYLACAGNRNGRVNFTVTYGQGFAHPAQVTIVDGKGRVFGNDSLIMGSYCILVKDAQGCLVATSCFDVREPVKLVASIAKLNQDCDIDGRITFTQISGGTTPYSIVWADKPNPATTLNADRTNLMAGTYSVTVYDAKGCAYVLDTIQVKNECPTKNSCTNFTATNKIENKLCTEGGKISVTLSGGTQPFTGDWSDLAGTVNPVNRTGLEAGTYSVTITDAAGCKTTLNNLIVKDECVSTLCTPPVVGDIMVTDATCGQSNGQINVTVLRPTNVTYTWSKNIGSSNIVNNLAADVYELKVSTTTDATCFTKKEIVVKNQNGVAVGQPSITPASCTAANGKVEFPSLGRPLDYVWSDGKKGSTRSDVTKGTYSITVTDPTGQWCKQVISLEMPAVNALAGVANITKKADCKTANGEATIQMVNGSGSYTYSWGASATKTGLKAGVYNVTVTDNQSGCQAVVVITMTENVAVFAMVNVAQSIIHLSCAGSNDGTVVYNVNYGTGFVTPARVVIADNFGRVAKNDNLGVGRYGIFVYDNNGCLAGMGNFEVKEPSLMNVNATVNAQTCKAKGSISVAVTGGSGIYKYSWSDAPSLTTPSRTDLNAGDYFIIVTDSKGCSKTVKLTVKNEALNCAGQCDLTATAAASPKICAVGAVNTEGGKIALTILNGSGKYGFLWSDLGTVAGQPQDRKDLAAGTYTVQIIDSTTNCKFKVLNIIVEDKAQNCNTKPCKITALADITDKNCMEGGIVKITPTSGTQPYKYDWVDLQGIDNPQNRFNMLPGTYTVYVIDNLGCRDTLIATIKDKCTTTCTPPMITNMTITDAACFENNGTIALTMSDASAYKYEWLPNVSTSNTATGLKSGVYKVKISRSTDALCFIEKDITVNNKNENLPLTAPSITNATCGTSNGAATINGDINWKYNWSDGKTGKTRSGLAAGNYFVTISDPSLAGCPVIQEVAIKSVSNILVTVQVDKKPTCGISNGQVTLIPTGGSGNYNYSWGTASRTNLRAGNYSVTVSDNQTGCNAVVNVSLSDAVAAGATINMPSPTATLNCRGDQNGKMDFTISYATGFAQPALVKITDELGNTAENNKLKAGKYKISITDANGCIAGSASFEILEPNMFMAKAATKPAECTVLGSITLDVTGGSGGYVYDWEDMAGTNNPKDRTNMAAGLYNVTIRDSKGCLVVVKNIAVANNCTSVKPKRDTIYKTVLVNRTDTFCMPIDRALVGQNLSYALCDGRTAMTNNFAIISVGTNGCVNYKTNGITGRDQLCVKSCNSIGICDTTDVFITILADPTACQTGYLGSTNLSITRCDTTATVCTNISYKQMGNYSVTDNGVPTSFYTEGCKQDTIFTYAYYTLVKFYPNGPWDLSSWTVNNRVYSARIPSIKALVDTLNTWDPSGNWSLDSAKNSVIGGDTRNIYGNMSWKRNGRNVATFQVNKQFVPAILSLRLPVGTHKVVFTDRVKGCKDSTVITVACNVAPLKVGSYTIDTVLFVGKRDVYCLNNGNWASQSIIRNVCVGSYKGYASYAIDDNNDCIRVIGVGLGRDTLCLKRCYNNGQCDTVKMVISVKPLISASDTSCIKAYSGLNYFNVPCGSKAQMCTNIQGTDTLNYAITVNGSLFKNNYYACSSDTSYAYTYFSLTLTNPTGPWKLDGWLVDGKTYSGIIPNIKALVDSMNRWDAGGNWILESASYTIKGGKNGRSYGNMTWFRNNTTSKIATFGPNRQVNVKQIGMLLDAGRHQIIFRNTLRGCSDTANILVECRQLRTRPSMVIKDTTINLNTTAKYCLPTNGLVATNTKLTPLKNVKGYISYISDDATDCVVITGANEGRDTIVLQRCDVEGECDTIKIAVNVVKKITTATENIFHSIRVGKDSTYCVKTNELKGTRFTLRNICERNASNNVSFFINGTCVSYSADNMGTDTACLVVCDELGGCDTTRLIVYVINERQTLPSPVAVNDRATTAKATKVNITPIVNDTVFGLPSDIVILTQPKSGTISFDEESKIVTYIPQSGECVGVDTFSYALVTMGGRDTAYIKVEVMCDEVVVFSGFSPNEDGVNDNFTILGLEKYPNNKLFVFNRFGNQVYTSDNYKNNWNAVTEGVIVPDGTYFYVLDLGNGKKLSGYVQIHR
jgi:gliding motility-associated-like protein